jgi:glutathione S-transferase
VDPLEHRKRAETIISDLEKRLQRTTYLFGNRPSLADYAILPFIRQFAFVDKEWFDGTDYQALQNWFAWFLDSPLFKAIMPKYSQWHEKDNAVLFGTEY